MMGIAEALVLTAIILTAGPAVMAIIVLAIWYMAERHWYR